MGRLLLLCLFGFGCTAGVSDQDSELLAIDQSAWDRWSEGLDCAQMLSSRQRAECTCRHQGLSGPNAQLTGDAAELLIAACVESTLYSESLVHCEAQGRSEEKCRRRACSAAYETYSARRACWNATGYREIRSRCEDEGRSSAECNFESCAGYDALGQELCYERNLEDFYQHCDQQPNAMQCRRSACLRLDSAETCDREARRYQFGQCLRLAGQRTTETEALCYMSACAVTPHGSDSEESCLTQGAAFASRQLAEDPPLLRIEVAVQTGRARHAGTNADVVASFRDSPIAGPHNEFALNLSIDDREEGAWNRYMVNLPALQSLSDLEHLELHVAADGDAWCIAQAEVRVNGRRLDHFSWSRKEDGCQWIQPGESLRSHITPESPAVEYLNLPEWFSREDLTTLFDSTMGSVLHHQPYLDFAMETRLSPAERHEPNVAFEHYFAHEASIPEMATDLGFDPSTSFVVDFSVTHDASADPEVPTKGVDDISATLMFRSLLTATCDGQTFRLAFSPSQVQYYLSTPWYVELFSFLEPALDGAVSIFTLGQYNDVLPNPRDEGHSAIDEIIETEGLATLLSNQSAALLVPVCPEIAIDDTGIALTWSPETVAILNVLRAEPEWF